MGEMTTVTAKKKAALKKRKTASRAVVRLIAKEKVKLEEVISSTRSGSWSAGSLMPSQVTDSYWISASRERGSYPAHTTRGGKWLVFVKSEHIDEFWLKIRDAVRDGLLGSSAKCSTAMP